MGIYTVAFYEHSLPVEARANIAQFLNDHISPAFFEALGMIARYWNDDRGAVRFGASEPGPGVASAAIAWPVKVEVIDRFLRADLGPRWRGFVGIPELREPFRAALVALGAALGSRQAWVVPGDQEMTHDYANHGPQDSEAKLGARIAAFIAEHGPPAERLSRCFRGWDHESHWVEPIGSREPTSALTQAKRFLEGCARRRADEENQAARGGTGPLPYVTRIAKDRRTVELDDFPDSSRLPFPGDWPRLSRDRWAFLLSRDDIYELIEFFGDEHPDAIVDLAIQLVRKERQNVANAAVSAWFEGVFEELPFWGSFAVYEERAGEGRHLLLRMRRDPGDPDAPAAFDGSLKPPPDPTPRAVLDAVERALRADHFLVARREKPGPAPALVIEADAAHRSFARFVVPASLLALLAERRARLHLTVGHTDELEWG